MKGYTQINVIYANMLYFRPANQYEYNSSMNFKVHDTNLMLLVFLDLRKEPGRVAQSVTCLATDACLTADPGVASSIPARYHTFVEIDHEIISTVILLPSADLFKKGCCQLQAKVCAQITG